LSNEIREREPSLPLYTPLTIYWGPDAAAINSWTTATLRLMSQNICCDAHWSATFCQGACCSQARGHTGLNLFLCTLCLPSQASRPNYGM